MNERIQMALDGELPREALRPGEREELAAYEEAVDGALAGLRAESAPDLRRPVMHRVNALPRHGRASAPAWKRALDWWWAPRPMTIRPAWGLAVAALAALLLLDPLGRSTEVPAPGAVASTEGVEGARGAASADGVRPAQVFVHFRLDAADARSVALAADFTGWEAKHALSEAAPGVWTVVVPVDAGVHEYAFVIDGQRWVADPMAPRVDDGFGGTNSRLDVVLPEAQPRRVL